jgi:hypothetical protein
LAFPLQLVVVSPLCSLGIELIVGDGCRTHLPFRAPLRV